MMRWVCQGQRALWVSAAAGVLGLGCGSADSGNALFEPPPPNPEPTVTPLPPEDDDEPGAEMTPSPAPGTSETPPLPSIEEEEEEEDPNARCRPANGVTGRPENISQALVLLNTLPKPGTLACFLQALERPLTIYMTSSGDSLQPAPDARNPRTFIINGNLVMSIVFGGAASNTLEFGYRPEVSRSIKAEIAFPYLRDLSERTLFEGVQVTPRTTKCGACHVGEAHEDFPGFPAGVFASDVIVPFEMDEVSIDSMKAEAAACDPTADEYRCGLLSALFDHGDVVRGTLPEPE